MAQDLKQVVLALGANMIKLAGLGEDIEKNKQNMLAQIKNGAGYQKFLQMVKQQGGNIQYIEHLEKFERAKYIESVVSKKAGIIQELPADTIAKYVCALGAGRIKKEDEIDRQVGIVLHKKVGDMVNIGENIMTIYSNHPIKQPTDLVMIGDIK